jgi:transcription initiation factor TFIIB
MMSSASELERAEWSENLNLTMICTDCREDPPNLVEEFSSGDMVCASCGLVLGDRIVDTRSEWRTFSNDDAGNDDPSRVGDGPNLLLNGSQLQTTIAFADGNARSRDLLRAQGKSTADKATKSLLAAYKEIGAHCDAVSIPKQVSDTAKHLYKMVDDAKAFKGKSTEAIIAGCIFIACRQCKLPRTFREIYALTKVSKKDIGRTFKALEKFLAGRNATANGKWLMRIISLLFYINMTTPRRFPYHRYLRHNQCYQRWRPHYPLYQQSWTQRPRRHQSCPGSHRESCFA